MAAVGARVPARPVTPSMWAPWGRRGLCDSQELVFSSLSFSHPLGLSLSKLRQLLLESQSQLDAAKSEAQKQSDELALVSELGVGRGRAPRVACE